MKPRVLFVSRERFRLPLDGAQKRKWDAIGLVIDARVIAAAPRGWPAADERFRLAPQLRPRLLDGPLYYLGLPWRIAGQLRDFRPQVALVQGVHELVAFLVARRMARSTAKAILDVQGDWRGATRLYGSRLRKLLSPLSDPFGPVAVRRADRVRTISGQTTALVRDLGVEPAASFAPFVDTTAFLDRPPEPLPDRASALFVGALERVKAFDTLAAAWGIAAQRLPDATLRIVGSGALDSVVRELAAEFPAGVEWTERVDAEEVAVAMDAAWLLVLPSRSEGLGRVLIEAACRGRAIVGGNRGGIPDVVHDGENGVLVDPDDPVALAAVLVRILSDRELAERLGASARRTGEELAVTPDEYAAKVLALVRSTLA